MSYLFSPVEQLDVPYGTSGLPAGVRSGLEGDFLILAAFSICVGSKLGPSF